MKKIWIVITVLAIAFAAYWFIFRSKKTENSGPDATLKLEAKTDGLNSNFGNMLAAYYGLQKAFVTSDTLQINSMAKAYDASLSALQLKEIKADSNLIKTAISFQTSIGAELQAMAKEGGLEDKRKSFQIISDALYDLIRTVKYDKATVYQAHCPMAFGGAGANWLSQKNEIINPYFGNEMLDCGSIVDSLNYQPAVLDSLKK